MTQEKLLIYAFALTAGWLLYKSITYVFIYNRLKKKLRNADLFTFITYLGEDYVYRFSADSTRRYKWKKGLLVIKASFDHDDRLSCKRISRFSLFTPFVKVIFS
jgi:hypothetical protein